MILFVDEGQRLSAEMLEPDSRSSQLRDLRGQALQIVMARTLELRDRIMAKRNKALRSRVFAPCLLNVMMPDEIAGMIEFRCNKAGSPNPFEAEAVAKIASLSGGVPRTTLLLRAHAWNMAKRLKVARVPGEFVQAAHGESNVGEAASEAVTA